MTRSLEPQLSETDYELIEANNLGSPLAVFKTRAIYISFLHLCVYLFVVFFLIYAGGALLSIGPYWQGPETGYLLFACFVVLAAGCLFGAVFLPLVELPEARKRRIIVCEQGLLEVKETLRGREVRILYWRDVRRIERQFGLYYIILPGREVFRLDLLIGNVGELIALIKQRSPYYR